MNIGIIIGSHRKASQSAKVGRFLSTLLETEFGAHTWTRDLGATPLPLWDEDIWNDGPQWQQLKALSAQLNAREEEALSETCSAEKRKRFLGT